MRLFAFSILILSLSSLSSCNQQVKEERLKRIDSLGTHLNYVRESLDDVDSVKLSNRINDVTQTIAWITDNITDTLNREPGIAFGDFARSKKYLSQSAARYKQVSSELRYSEKQLEGLRTDVKNSFYSEEEFNGYFNTEASSIQKLVEATDELKSKNETSNARYDKLKPVVTNIVDSIKSVIYAAEPVRS